METLVMETLVGGGVILQFMVSYSQRYLFNANHNANPTNRTDPTTKYRYGEPRGVPLMGTPRVPVGYPWV